MLTSKLAFAVKINHYSFILLYLVRERTLRFLDVKINLKTSVKASGTGVQWAVGGTALYLCPVQVTTSGEWLEFPDSLSVGDYDMYFIAVEWELDLLIVNTDLIFTVCQTHF